HQPVLNSYVEQSSQRETVAGRGITSEISSRQLFVESRARSVHIFVYTIESRPISGKVGRQASIDGVDAEGEEPVQLRLHTLQAKDAIPKQIPIERFEVPDIKNDTVALRNRPLVEEVATNNLEERVTFAASVEETVRKFTAGFGDSLGG
ncbi:MAG: hypothetical protein WAN60_08230, partial [Candidatus Sulfotelmatobacter sp.]